MLLSIKLTGSGCACFQQREIVGKKLERLLKKQEKAVASDIVRLRFNISSFSILNLPSHVKLSGAVYCYRSCLCACLQ